MPVHTLRDFPLQSGVIMDEVRLSYQTYGQLNPRRDNLVVFPTYFTGRQTSNEPYFGAGRALDPARHCILVPCLIGNGQSTSPSNTDGAQGGGHFPHVTIADNVRLQRSLVESVLGVEDVALAIGWSMGGCQAFEWAVQVPDRVKRLLPFCASARCAPINRMFLECVRAALTADGDWKEGHYDTPPTRGLAAFGRAYCGWAYSQAYFAEGEYKGRGFADLDALLADWEADHLDWDANDLLCKLWAWQHHDVSANAHHNGDIAAALGSIKAHTIIMPSSTDMYFTQAHAEIEAAMIPGADFRPFASTWGHCAMTPGAPAPGFMDALDAAINDLLSS